MKAAIDVYHTDLETLASNLAPLAATEVFFDFVGRKDEPKRITIQNLHRGVKKHGVAYRQLVGSARDADSKVSTAADVPEVETTVEATLHDHF